MKNEHDQHKEMSDILKAELDREAREILAEIEADESLQGLTMPDEAEDELMQKIQKLEEKKAAYEMLSDADQEALRIGREIQMQKENGADGDKVVTFKKRKKRVWLLVAAVALLALGMGMTSVGEVPLVTEIKETLFGKNEMTHVDSERGDEARVEEHGDDELAIYEEIKDTFGVRVVKLEDMPNGTRVHKYEIDKTLNKATILYQCDETIFNYRMIFNYRNQVSGFMTEEELIAETDICVEDILVQLKKYRVKDSEEIMYVIEFKYQDVYYMLTATTSLSEAEMIKILENMKKF